MVTIKIHLRKEIKFCITEKLEKKIDYISGIEVIWMRYHKTLNRLWTDLSHVSLWSKEQLLNFSKTYYRNVLIPSFDLWIIFWTSSIIRSCSGLASTWRIYLTLRGTQYTKLFHASTHPLYLKQLSSWESPIGDILRVLVLNLRTRFYFE